MKTPLLMAAISVAFILAAAKPVAAMVFEVVFDDDVAEKPKPIEPYVGAGTLSFDGTMPDGSYSFNGLTNLKFQFNFEDGESFDQGNALKYDPSLALVIYDNGKQFYFDGPPPCPDCGSLQVYNGAKTMLFFQPNTVGTPPLNSYLVKGTNSFYQGTYGVPAPLPLLGAGAGFGWSRQLRRRLAKAQPPARGPQ